MMIPPGALSRTALFQSSIYSGNYYRNMHHIAIDDYVVDVLLPDLCGHDRSPAAFLVYVVLWTRLFRSAEQTTRISLQSLAAQTGLSKSSVQAGIRLLLRRGLIKAAKASPTAIP